MKSTIKVLFSITIILTALFAGSFPVKAETFEQCLTQNPEGTMVCSAGQRYINNACRPYSEVQSVIGTCTETKKDTYSCSSNSCVCQSGYPRDCRSTSYFARCVTDTDYNADPNGCAAAYKELNKCTKICGSCSAGYELVNGQCINLEMVEGRVTSLEGASICYFDAAGNYVNDQGQPCPETFNPSTLDGRLTINETGTRVLMQIMANLLGLDALTGDTVKSYLKEFVQQLCVLDPTLNCGVTDWDAVTAEELLVLANKLMTAVVAKFNALVDQRISEAIEQAQLQFSGITTATYTAGFTGTPQGYAGANAVCAAQYADSHVCTNEEILKLYNTNSTLPSSGKAWISGGAPGYSAAANDCQGWSVISGESFGRYWNFEKMSGWLSQCTANLYAFACCK